MITRRHKSCCPLVFPAEGKKEHKGKDERDGQGGRKSKESTIENCGGIDEAKWFFQEINTPEIHTRWTLERSGWEVPMTNQKQKR